LFRGIARSLAAILILALVFALAALASYYAAILAEKEREISVLRSRAAALNLLNEDLQRRVDDLQSQLHSFQQLLAEREEDLTRLNETLKRLKADLATLQRENSVLKLNCTRLASENKYLREKLAFLESVLKLEKSVELNASSTALLPGESLKIASFNATYPGYVKIYVHVYSGEVYFTIRGVFGNASYAYSVPEKPVGPHQPLTITAPVLPGVVEVVVVNASGEVASAYIKVEYVY